MLRINATEISLGYCLVTTPPLGKQELFDAFGGLCQRRLFKVGSPQETKLLERWHHTGCLAMRQTPGSCFTFAEDGKPLETVFFNEKTGEITSRKIHKIFGTLSF